MSSRQAQVENGCEEEEEEDYPQEEQMDAEESTETRKPSKYASLLKCIKITVFKFIKPYTLCISFVLFDLKNKVFLY